MLPIAMSPLQLTARRLMAPHMRGSSPGCYNRLSVANKETLTPDQAVAQAERPSAMSKADIAERRGSRRLVSVHVDREVARMVVRPKNDPWGQSPAEIQGSERVGIELARLLIRAP